MGYWIQRIKGSIIKRLRRHAVKPRLRTAFICTSIIPLIALSIFCTVSYQIDMNKKLTDTFVQVLHGLSKTVDVSMGKYLDYSYPIITSDEVNNLLWNSSGSRDADMGTLVENSGMGKYLWSESYDNIMIYDMDFQKISSFGGIEPNEAEFIRMAEKLKESEENHEWCSIKNKISGNSIAFIKKIYSKNNWDTQIGYLCFLFNERRLFRPIYEDVHIENDADIFLIDHDGNYISSKNEKDKIGRVAKNDFSDSNKLEKLWEEDHGSFESIYNGKHSLLIYQYNQTLDAVMVTAVESSEMNRSLVRVSAVIVSVTAFIIVLCILIVRVMNDSIVIPISNLLSYIKNISKGDYGLEIDDDSEDEMGELTRYSGNMVKQLIWYMRKIEEDGKERRKLEIRNLQYQIQPHFLFNTLNIFKYIAIINNVESLGNGIGALSSLLKNTVSLKDEMIPLAEEIQNIRHYICIQEFRYTGCMEVHYDISEESNEQTVPRLLLQPLVENSIVHGMKEDAVLGIWIRAYVENSSLCIEVEDNGQGFNVETSREKKQKFSGIGMENIEERIHLIYQKKGKFQIKSIEGEGTVVSIDIPIQEV